MRTSARVRRIQGEKANYRKRGLLCKIKYTFGSTRILHQIIKGACVTHTVPRNAGRNTQPHKASLVLGFITNVGPHVVPILIDGKRPFDFTENWIRPLQSSWLKEGLKKKGTETLEVHLSPESSHPRELIPSASRTGGNRIFLAVFCVKLLGSAKSKLKQSKPTQTKIK